MKAKALLLPVGIGLAHVGRLIVVAKELRNRGVSIIFGAGGDAVSILQKEDLDYRILPEFDRKAYEEKVKKNNPFIYTKKIIKDFISAELALYRQEKPDIIIYDTRLTAKISARIAGIPTVSINNVDATPYYDFSQIKMPAQTIFGRYLPEKFLSFLNKEYSQNFLHRVGPSIVRAVLLSTLIRLSPTLLRLGFRPSLDPYQFFLGDLTLLCDIPEFRPVKPLPENIKMIGPIFWESKGVLPEWHKKITSRKDIVYVTAGGTGDKKTFIKILEYLRGTNFCVIATTGNTLKPEEVTVTYRNLFLSTFLPGDWIMSRARLVIFPGGNATVYQALSYGVPQICTPFHIDQEDNSNQLERLQTGILLNPYANFTQEKFLEAVRSVLENRKYVHHAKQIQTHIRGFDGKRQAAEEIISFLTRLG